jgi:membrane protein implicated in regulation of membrane protease activity
MFNAELILQAIVVVGLIMVLMTLLIGIEVGIDLLLIGSILIMSGLLGIWTDSVVVCLIVASILSVMYVVYGRSTLKKKLIFRTQSTNIDKLIGETAIVSKEIASGGFGIVKLGDEEWRAHSADLHKAGEKVTVLAVEGVTLEVAKK